MKKLTLLLLFIPSLCFGQLPGLNQFVATDSIYMDGSAYSVVITEDLPGSLTYYFTTDSEKKKRTVLKTRIDGFVNIRKGDLKSSRLETEALKGKTILVQVSPFKPALTKYWQAVIDDGVNGQYVLTSENGDKIKLPSEMAFVNYLIGQGFELYEIKNVNKGYVGGATSFFESSSIGGGSIISSNVYFFKAVYKGE